MIDSYVILNRKVKGIVKLFTINMIFILILVIWGINTLYFYSFFHIHSQIVIIDSHCFLEVLVPVEEVNQITGKDKIKIDNREYNYQTYKIDSNITYKDGKNCQKLYLEVFDLDDTYRVNGYQLEVKIAKEKKRIIDYFKNEKEEL